MNELKERKNSKSKTGGIKIKQINLLKFKY